MLKKIETVIKWRTAEKFFAVRSFTYPYFLEFLFKNAIKNKKGTKLDKIETFCLFHRSLCYTTFAFERYTVPEIPVQRTNHVLS